jgi:hypothetical protein
MNLIGEEEVARATVRFFRFPRENNPMTTIELILGVIPKSRIIRPIAKKIHRDVNDMGTHGMEALLITLVTLASGSQILASITPGDPDFVASTICGGGGVLGVLIGLSCSWPKNGQAMAQEIFGNLSCAIAFGPLSAPWFAARFSVESPTFQWFVAVGAAWGIIGLAIVRGLRSDAVSQAKCAIAAQFGLQKAKDDVPPS